MLFGPHLLVVFFVVLVVIGNVSSGDMARSGDRSHVSARRNDGASSILWHSLGVCVSNLVHGAHVPANYKRMTLQYYING
jgi:hypothetical protein